MGDGRLLPCSSYRPSWTPLSCALQWLVSGASDEVAPRKSVGPWDYVVWLWDCWLQKKAEKPTIGKLLRGLDLSPLSLDCCPLLPPNQATTDLVLGLLEQMIHKS